MFRFWTSETSRGCDKTTTTESDQHSTHFAATQDYFNSAHAPYNNFLTAPVAAAPAAGANMAAAATRKRSREPETVMPPSPSAALDPPAQQEQRALSPTKRVKRECSDSASDGAPGVFGAWGLPPFPGTVKTDPSRLESPPSPPLSVSQHSMAEAAEIERMQDIVQFEFGHEILLKHNELRLIEQEMARCQVALEQLRRCHLIPYPTACPTPQQMLDIASGRGTAVRPRPGATVPKWAAPFGVVDGPYARHYAKWLIPDPVFDGPLPNWPGVVSQPTRSKSSATAESRATRHAVADSSKGRPTRGAAGQKLHALSSGYPQPKDKAGPCVLKRSDGKVVKLVCIDCHRDNFSSTQGFINHCRIAHKRDFKSHEEAAVHCGHPIEADGANNQTRAPNVVKSEPSHLPSAAAAAATPSTAAATTATSRAASVVSSSTKPGPSAAETAKAVANANASIVSATAPAGSYGSPAATFPGYVSPLARPESGALDELLQHVTTAYRRTSQLVKAEGSTKADVKSVPVKSEASSQQRNAAGLFVGSQKTPNLTKYLENRFSGDLEALVEDAKTKTNIDAMQLDEDEDTPSNSAPASPRPATAIQRVPARQVVATTASASRTKPGAAFVGNMDGACDIAASSTSMPFATSTVSGDTQMYDDEMDADLSPNPASSNNAPSLVSDDGEYDDSDDGSSSVTSDTDLESVSDVAEINMDEDEDQAHDTPRPLRHHRGSSGTATALKLKKDGEKHVTFVSPVRGNSGGRRK